MVAYITCYVNFCAQKTNQITAKLVDLTKHPIQFICFTNITKAKRIEIISGQKNTSLNLDKILVDYF